MFFPLFSFQALGCSVEVPTISACELLDQLINLFCFYNGSVRRSYQVQSPFVTVVYAVFYFENLICFLKSNERHCCEQRKMKPEILCLSALFCSWTAVKLWQLNGLSFCPTCSLDPQSCSTSSAVWGPSTQPMYVQDVSQSSAFHPDVAFLLLLLHIDVLRQEMTVLNDCVTMCCGIV